MYLSSVFLSHLFIVHCLCPCPPALMLYSGCASITLPPSAAGTTCTSMMETPFIPLWLPSSGEHLLFWIGELCNEGNMEMTQVAFGTASKGPLVQSNDSTHGQTIDLIIAALTQYSSNKKKILQLLTLSLNATCYLLLTFPKNNLRACGRKSFISCKLIKNHNILPTSHLF